MRCHPLFIGEHNGHSSIKFRVMLSFSNGDNNYQKEFVSHKDTAPEAITEAMMQYLANDTSDDMPLVGIVVYQSVFTA